MTTRTIRIKTPKLPGGAESQLELVVSLVDGNKVPATRGTIEDDRVIVGEGRHVAGADGLDLVLTTQDSIPGETFWRVEIPRGRSSECYYVQIAAGADMTWDEFLGSGSPVDPGDLWASRLLPTNPTNGQIAVWDEGQGAWVAATASGTGDMQAIIYDPRGISDDTFDLGNLTGNIDCPTF